MINIFEADSSVVKATFFPPHDLDGVTGTSSFPWLLPAG